MMVLRGWIAAILLVSVAAIYPEIHSDQVKDSTRDATFESSTAVQCEMDTTTTSFVRRAVSPSG